MTLTGIMILLNIMLLTLIDYIILKKKLSKVKGIIIKLIYVLLNFIIVIAIFSFSQFYLNLIMVTIFISYLIQLIYYVRKKM
ncbi:hypothetical protein JCM19376_13570 [Fusibacter bizertensis]